jgi:hypothetical protein
MQFSGQENANWMNNTVENKIVTKIKKARRGTLIRILSASDKNIGR